MDKFYAHGKRLQGPASDLEIVYSSYMACAYEGMQRQRHSESFGNMIIHFEGLWGAAKRLATLNSDHPHIGWLLLRTSNALLWQFALLPLEEQHTAVQSVSGALKLALSNLFVFPFATPLERLMGLDDFFNLYLNLYRLKKTVGPPVRQNSVDELFQMEKALDQILSEITRLVLQLPGSKDVLIQGLVNTSELIDTPEIGPIWAIRLLLLSMIVGNAKGFPSARPFFEANVIFRLYFELKLRFGDKLRWIFPPSERCRALFWAALVLTETFDRWGKLADNDMLIL